ncbi:MAG TPA: GTP-binding protein [Acidobacteriota bacterium]|nr:GTP-binding protein [Acidobacteriota bacterium]
MANPISLKDAARANASKPTTSAGKPELNARDSVKREIEELERQLSGTKYNKSSQGYFAQVKAKIAMLKAKLTARAGGGKAPEGFAVRKTGDGTVVLLGFPSVGKSTLLNTLTNAQSATAAYAFTTLTCIPGLLEYKSAKMQILDVPGIIEGAAAGTGRGKEVLQVIRTADFVLMVIDVFHPEHYEKLLKEVAEFNIRLNRQRPAIKITKTIKNGIRVGATVPLTKIDTKTIEQVCKLFKMVNAEILIRSDIDADDLIDTIEGNKVYLPALVVFNKIDIADEETIKRACEYVKPDLMISAQKKSDVHKLRDLLYDKMEFIRVYLKEVGKQADMKEPLIMRKGQTVGDVCNKLHKDFYKNFKFARIWGTSVKFPGQKLLKLEHQLADQDVLELHLK